MDGGGAKGEDLLVIHHPTHTTRRGNTIRLREPQNKV